MERSELQEIAAASRFDAHTTYNTSVGSAPQEQLQRAREINRLPGAGASSIDLATHVDLSNGVPETVDWAGNPAPQWRRRPADDEQMAGGQHRGSLRYDGGYLVSGKGGDADFRPSRKIPESAMQGQDQLVNKTNNIQREQQQQQQQQLQSPAQRKEAERWISNSRASWGTSFSGPREEERGDSNPNDSAAGWKSSYQLMGQSQPSSSNNNLDGNRTSSTTQQYDSSNDRNPVGRSKSYRPCRKPMGPRIQSNSPSVGDFQHVRRRAALTDGGDDQVVDVSASVSPRETYNMRGMSGDQLLSGINSAAMARAIHKGALPVGPSSKSTTANGSTTSAGQRVPKPNRNQIHRARLPGCSFD